MLYTCITQPHAWHVYPIGLLSKCQGRSTFLWTLPQCPHPKQAHFLNYSRVNGQWISLTKLLLNVWLTSELCQRFVYPTCKLALESVFADTHTNSLSLNTNVCTQHPTIATYTHPTHTDVHQHTHTHTHTHHNTQQPTCSVSMETASPQ